MVLKIMKINQHNITETDLYSYNLPLSLFPLLKRRQMNNSYYIAPVTTKEQASVVFS